MSACRSDPVDCVITWVNGNDPDHSRKRQKWLAAYTSPSLHPMAAQATRFADAGELWYAVRLLRWNAPWIRTIFLVTDAQKPAWLTDRVEREFGLVVVDHRTLFSGYEEYLPTFSSRAIEAMLHRIPALADHFIYLNDDFFVIGPVDRSTYFDGEVPRVRGRWAWSNRYVDYLARNIRRRSGYGRGYVGKRPEVERAKQWRFFSLAHAPYPINRKDFSRLFASDSFLRSIIRYRFRDNNQVWPIGYYVNRMIERGRLDASEVRDWEYIAPTDTKRFRRRVLSRVQGCTGIRHLCVQSLDRFEEDVKRDVLRALETFAENA